MLSGGSSSTKEPEMLTALTRPLTNAIVQLDKKVLEAIAQNMSNSNDTLIRHFCPKNISTDFENGTLIYVLDKDFRCNLSRRLNFKSNVKLNCWI